jgi:hypothetical protein
VEVAVGGAGESSHDRQKWRQGQSDPQPPANTGYEPPGVSSNCFGWHNEVWRLVSIKLEQPPVLTYLESLHEVATSHDRHNVR